MCPSPILCDTVILLVFAIVFIHSNVHLPLVYFLRDGSLDCFCSLAESYETINQFEARKTELVLSISIYANVNLKHIHLFSAENRGMGRKMKTLQQHRYDLLRSWCGMTGSPIGRQTNGDRFTVRTGFEVARKASDLIIR